MRIYRPKDGKAVRWGAVAVTTALGIYASQSWYYWAKVPGRFGAQIGKLPFGVGEIGGVVILLGMVLASFWVCFAHARASNFLIEVEIELRKVTWPSIKPWLSTKSEVWASTYIVLAVVAILVLFVYVVDLVLTFASRYGFYS